MIMRTTRTKCELNGQCIVLSSRLPLPKGEHIYIFWINNIPVLIMRTTRTESEIYGQCKVLIMRTTQPKVELLSNKAFSQAKIGLSDN